MLDKDTLVRDTVYVVKYGNNIFKGNYNDVISFILNLGAPMEDVDLDIDLKDQTDSIRDFYEKYYQYLEDVDTPHVLGIYDYFEQIYSKEIE